MAFPDASTERLSIRSLQQWIFSLLMRRSFGYVTALTILELTTMYALVLAVILLLSGLSGDFLGNLVGRLPSLQQTPLGDPSASFILSGVFFALYVASGVTGALVRRRFSVSLEGKLKTDILRNAALWIAPRPDFVINDGVSRRVTALLSRSRAVVRSARAMVGILPSVLFLLTAIVGLLFLFPAALVWLAALGGLSVVVQRFANSRIVALEREYSRSGADARAIAREHVALHDKAEPSAEERSRRDELDAIQRTLSHRYFTRNTLTQLTRYTSFGVMAAVSFMFLVLLLTTQPEMAEGALVETFIVLLVVARTIVGAIAGIAANQAILAKYAVHAHQTFLYFHGSTTVRRPASLPEPTRLVGPETPSTYGISFYLDALNELADTDLRRYGRGISWDASNAILVVDPGATNAAYPVVIVPPDTKTEVRLEPGDTVVLYTRNLRVTKPHTLTARRYRQMYRRDIAQCQARPKSGAGPEPELDPMMEDDEEF